jgi:hypothetical protein
VFDPHETPEDTAEPIRKPESKTEYEDAGLHHDWLASQVDEMLAESRVGVRYHLSPVTQGHEKGFFDVVRPRGYSRDDALCHIPQAVVGLIPRPDALGPYVLYEIAAARARKRERTYVYCSSLPAITLPIVALFVPPLDEYFSTIGIAALLLLLLYMTVDYLIVHYLFRRSLFKLEAGLAATYPSYIETIRTLVDAGYASEPGVLSSLWERLQHLEKSGDRSRRLQQVKHDQEAG